MFKMNFPLAPPPRLRGTCHGRVDRTDIGLILAIDRGEIHTPQPSFRTTRVRSLTLQPPIVDLNV